MSSVYDTIDDPTDLQAQARARSKKEQRSIGERLQAQEDFKWLMGTPQGRRIVWRILDQSGVFHATFNTNALLMAHAEGERNFGLRTMAMVMANCPELYPTMIQENRNDRSSADSGRNESNS